MTFKKIESAEEDFGKGIIDVSQTHQNGNIIQGFLIINLR